MGLSSIISPMRPWESVPADREVVGLSRATVGGEGLWVSWTWTVGRGAARGQTSSGREAAPGEIRAFPEFPGIFRAPAEISARAPRARMVTPCAQFAPRITSCDRKLFGPQRDSTRNSTTKRVQIRTT